MEKVDARKQTPEVVHRRRQEVVRYYREGIPVTQIVQRIGLSRSAVDAAIKQYLAGGELALKPAARGRKEGTGRKLTQEQEVAIRQDIRLQCPQFYGLKSYLWNRIAVKQLIAQKYEITLSLRGLDGYLVRWGLTQNKSKGQAYARCTKAIRDWLDAHEADIALQATRHDAVIYWLNRLEVLDANYWGPPNASSAHNTMATEKIEVREKVAMASVVNNQGKEYWVIVNGSFNAKEQIRFLRSLIKDTRRKMLLLIRSDAAMYSNPNTLNWARANRRKIRIYPAPDDQL